MIRLPELFVSGKSEGKKKKAIPLVLNVRYALRVSAHPEYVVADSPSSGKSPAEATDSDRGKLRHAAAMLCQDQGPSRHGQKEILRYVGL